MTPPPMRNVRCPRCGNTARVPLPAIAWCNNHTGHRHSRGEPMVDEDEK